LAIGRDKIPQLNYTHSNPRKKKKKSKQMTTIPRYYSQKIKHTNLKKNSGATGPKLNPEVHELRDSTNGPNQDQMEEE
jgi:hypothetical protein